MGSGLYVGIDVSKARLDVAFGKDGAVAEFANSEEGIGQLAARLAESPAELVVLEATGGYEGLVAGVLAGPRRASGRGQPTTGARFRKGDGCPCQDGSRGRARLGTFCRGGASRGAAIAERRRPWSSRRW